jgi:hypothetical protein
MGIFVILHGLVHLWFVVLSQELVAFKPEMGWTGESWLFTGLLGSSAPRTLASVVYVLATAAFVIAGAGILFEAAWAPSLVRIAAVFSGLMILLFWDGSPQLIVEKGLLGFLINVGLVVASLW